MLAELVFNYVYDERFIYQSLATIITYSTIRIVLFYRTRMKRYQLFKYYNIPGPKPNIFDGNLSNYLKYKPKLYEADVEFSKTYGNIYGVFIGDLPIIKMTDLSLLKQIFLKNSNNFKLRTMTTIKTSIVDGILFAHYDRWKVFRKVMSPLFSSYVMRGSSSTIFIEDSIKLMLEYIDGKIMMANVNVKEIDLDIQALMKSTALHMISNMAVKLPNVQVSEDEENVKSLDKFLIQSDKGIVIQAIRFPFLNRILSFLAQHLEHGKTLSLIRRGLDERIHEQLANLTRPDDAKDVQLTHLIDLLIKLYHEGKITYSEVIANSESILFAGYDTTSTTLTYVFWVVAKYPQIQEKLRQDLKAHGIESKYLEQVINETMRLYPTVLTFTSRLCTDTLELDGLVIPKGAVVIHHNWLLFHNAEIWPEPEKFDPERFIEGKDIHPCAYAPFGLGERKCLGYKLAELEIKMILCDILLRYGLELKSPQDLELITYASVLTKPQEKVIVGLKKL